MADKPPKKPRPVRCATGKVISEIRQKQKDSHDKKSKKKK